MSDAKDKQVQVKVYVDGECVHDSVTSSLYISDDDGTYSMNIDGLIGAVAEMVEVSHHFSKAIIDIKDDTPFEMFKAKVLELLKARMLLTAMCSSLTAFGEGHDLKEFRDTADKLHDTAVGILEEIDTIKMADDED